MSIKPTLFCAAIKHFARLRFQDSLISEDAGNVRKQPGRNNPLEGRIISTGRTIAREA
jgi:hypothetical protein